MNNEESIKHYCVEYKNRVRLIGCEVSFKIANDQYCRPKYWEEIAVNEGDDIDVLKKVFSEFVIQHGKEHAENVNDATKK